MSIPNCYPTHKAAEILGGLSPRTLERWRLEGKGPAFVRAGSRCLYREDDLLAWLDANRRTSTSDTGAEAA